MAGFKRIAFVALSFILFECCIIKVATKLNAGTCRVVPFTLQPPAVTKKAGKIYGTFQTNEVSWRQAWEECRNKKMNLVTLESKKVDNELTTILSTGYYWTSGRRLGNQWFWLTTTSLGNGIVTPVNYTNWVQGEPDDRGGVEDCMVVDGQLGWRDLPCSHTAFYVCERYEIS